MEMISDEIRSFVKRSYADEHMDPRELLALADRVDRETMPRPRAADGEPVVMGETLYDGSGNEWAVSDLTATFLVVAKGDGPAIIKPGGRDLSHRRPDSLGRIADELDDLSESGEMADETSADMRDLAERIRKLAAKEDEQCH